MADALPPSVPEGHESGHFPPLALGEWLIFGVLAALLAAANIYTTLLIGWGDTGSIIAVLLSVVMLSVIRPDKPSVHVLNLGQTMVSAGGSVGFAVATYAAVRIVQPDFAPSEPLLIVLFAAMGVLGAMIGSMVRKQMVGYFFPSGTACAVIQRAITAPLAPGERNRPVFLLTIWGSIAALASLPVKIAFQRGGSGLLHDLMFMNGAGQAWAGKGVGIGADPLYYGIGIVVGPRVGLGMLLGSLAVPFLLVDGLAGGPHEAKTGEWIRWCAIALLTLPTFATIVFAYLFKQQVVVPPGFSPGRTQYTSPSNMVFVYGMLGALGAAVVAWTAQAVFGLPWWVVLVTIVIAFPLCVVNGRVTGDTDINPVRLVAIVLLSGFFWMISEGTIAMLGMAVVGGTLAAIAVDMMQDYRTGYLVDANPVHQTSVQFVGSIIGAVVAIPMLGLLVDQLGVGPDSQLPAPGAQVWATMAQAMADGFDPSAALWWAIGSISVLGSVYAYLTVWPVTAAWMPSLFGIGIGMLVGIPTSAGILMGGLIKWLVTKGYLAGKTGDERDQALDQAGNDTMLAGSSVFAVAAILSILLVLVTAVFDYYDLDIFYLAH